MWYSNRRCRCAGLKPKSASDGTEPMTYAPETQSGSFFNNQERDVRSVQVVEALSLTRNWWRGQHVFKVGTDVQRSWYEGSSISRLLEIRRLDGSLAERTVFGGPTLQDSAAVEIAFFAQDRWRLGSRVTLELGIRADRDGIVEHINWAPRAGAAIGVLPEGRAIVRGGFGKFVQRTPLNVSTFESFEPRFVSRFAPSGAPLGGPLAIRNVLEDDLHTPEAYVANVEWDQRFGRRFLLKAGISAATWLARVHRDAGARRRTTVRVEHRVISLQRARSHGALSGWWPTRPDVLVRVGERDR